MARVGIVGIGAMGRGMALNLCKDKVSGNGIALTALTVFDTSSDNINRFIAMANTSHSSNVHIANSISDLTKNSDIICLSLPRYRL